ncbi:MAG: hypothetical protein EAZ42_10465 [Verrucomicrobia bacterium]|nr:MAG: hypothetical protein EAZ42_10465 [Verrucomicrobiota bacterium]
MHVPPKWKKIGIMVCTVSSLVVGQAAGLENILSNPNFEKRGGGIYDWRSGGYVGGNPDTGKLYENTVAIVHEGEKRFLRMSGAAEFPDFAFSPFDRLPLLPEWKSLTPSAVIRMSGFKKVETWGGFNMWLKFYDADGKEIPGQNNAFVRCTQDQDWLPMSQTFPIPAGAYEVSFHLYWLSAGGVADVMNLQLKPL